MAMRLHTRDQAPKEGEREAAEQAWKQVILVQTIASAIGAFAPAFLACFDAFADVRLLRYSYRLMCLQSAVAAI